MKNTITFLAFLWVTVTFQAQDESFTAKTKGTYFANGSLNIFSTTRKVNDNKSDAFTIEFMPRAGYFIMDRLAVGLGLVVSSNKETTDSGLGEIETTVTGFGIAPLARYYFENNIFGEAAVGFGTTKTKIEGSGFGDSNVKSNTFGFRIGAGYAFFLGNHIALEPSINYSWEDINPEDAPSGYDESLSSIFLNIGITAFF
ncbi:autotransporter outer membrane beta-barrel domain-containing protein [Aquimarina celericrescens]|uniref:Autotransporter outer membrane beta-barrel domain-containing protein n=1 Tax=Aquimarina celericrescens TaxID=1964542 RepID=A0ABW5AV96_9FLAO|nr:autotransporter outer membrane beta-barrel domain-containing protein [Aquimarina celericrescens]